MNIELSITDITESNRHKKLTAAAYALSEQMGLDAEIKAPWLEKARAYKYISKEWKNGQWVYEYPNTENEKVANLANQCELITGIKPLRVNVYNAAKVATKELLKLQGIIRNGDYRCPALENRKIADVNIAHTIKKGATPRKPEVIMKRARFIPFILPIISKTGHLHDVRKNSDGTYSYEIVGRVEIDEKDKQGQKIKKKYAVSVVLFDKEKKPGKNLLYISVFGISHNMIKSIQEVAGLATDPMNSHWVAPGNYLPGTGFLRSQGSGLSVPRPPGKPGFGFPNGLDLRYLQPQAHNLIIPYISAKSIEKYPDIEIFIQNITGQNKKAKFAKAIRAAASRLNVPVSVGKKGARESRAGEPYMYPVQQELSDYWTGYYQAITRKIYKVVIDALGLPPVAIETMRKALGESGNLRYRGTVIYNPETGKPLKVKEFIVI